MNLTSWKTTVTGCAAAALTVVEKLYASGTVDPQTLISAGGMAILGYFAKDWNVQGSGTVPSKPPDVIPGPQFPKE